MSRLVVIIVVTALGLEWFGAGCLLGQTEQRKMLYSHRAAIADRLLPDDTAVWVYREVGAPYILNPRERRTYEQEIESARDSDIIALVRVASAQGELIEKRTWVRTNVVAHIDQLVQTNLKTPLVDTVEFTFSGGNTRIADVDVTAGSFARFIPGESYRNNPRVVDLTPCTLCSATSRFHSEQTSADSGSTEKTPSRRDI